MGSGYIYVCVSPPRVNPRDRELRHVAEHVIYIIKQIAYIIKIINICIYIYMCFINAYYKNLNIQDCYRYRHQHHHLRHLDLDRLVDL